jgi:hypothetical protein
MINAIIFGLDFCHAAGARQAGGQNLTYGTLT